MADAAKAKGDAAFKTGDFDTAIEHYSEAIELNSSNHVLFSNRSACHASLKQYEQALEDAQKCVDLKPDWPKGYSRLGGALFGKGSPEEAAKAYQKGLDLDPSNEGLKKALQEAEAAGKKSPMSGLFGPQFMAKLATNPKTRAYLSQPDFMQMLQMCQTNPQMMTNFLGDPRFQEAFSVGLGINMMSPEAARANGGGPPGMDTSAAAEEDDDDMPPLEEDPAPSQPAAPKPAPKPAAKPAPKPAPEPEPEDPAKQKKQAAAKEKDLGNAAYKRKAFDEAIAHYDRAIGLDEQDISFITNKAAVQFEKGDYEACVADCDLAVETGRALRADYKLVAKAMARKGNALVRLKKLEEATQVYHKSLMEHRNADTLKRLNDTEKALKQQQDEAYVNMDTALEERNKGNEAFKLQKYDEAHAHYTEALKRGPPSVNEEAYKLYSNRAACYTKLGAWNEGLKDAEECIRLNPSFGKGYSRKGHLQFFMKEYDKATITYKLGLEKEPDNAELKDGLQRCMEAQYKFNRGEATEDELKERQARAMSDPEVQNILSDPVMRQVLNDMQSDPKAAATHMRHPDIATKLQKLMNAGIVQMR
ncbi:hypothetical protein WJX74_000655 [Apatococcus lobatus]|uniref:STI1 domain-containing protein n=1 Tax=Apatococcus lobatus TaxID=904363 RepID=A0AAW1RY19_9CHLO